MEESVQYQNCVFYLMDHLYKAMVSLESAAAALQNRETEEFLRRQRARNRVIEH